MTSIMERHYYRSDILLAHESAPMYMNLSHHLRSNEDVDDVLPILFRLYKSIESTLISDYADAGVIHEEITTELEAKKLIRVPRADTSMCSMLVIEALNDMNVPEEEKETILGKVFQACPRDHHELPVIVMVDIYEVTLQRRRRMSRIPATRFR